MRGFVLAAVVSSCLFVLLDAQYPVTFGMISKICPLADPAKLRTFLNSLNSDKTTAAKKSRAKTWITANIGKTKIPNLCPYAKPAAAIAAANALLDHRDEVAAFWNDLTPKLTKTFDKTTAAQYKQMWQRTDKTFDNEFYDALYEWYAYCHYRSPNSKRAQLYSDIQAVTTKHNNTKLNWQVESDDYWTPVFMAMLFGSW